MGRLLLADHVVKLKHNTCEWPIKMVIDESRYPCLLLWILITLILDISSTQDIDTATDNGGKKVIFQSFPSQFRASYGMALPKDYLIEDLFRWKFKLSGWLAGNNREICREMPLLYTGPLQCNVFHCKTTSAWCSLVCSCHHFSYADMNIIFQRAFQDRNFTLLFNWASCWKFVILYAFNASLCTTGSLF